MVELIRKVRFAVNQQGRALDGQADSGSQGKAGVNGYAGVPAMSGVGFWFEFEARCRGVPDSRTGYLLDIKVVDRAVREAAVPVVAASCGELEAGSEQCEDEGRAKTKATEPGSLMPTMVERLNRLLAGKLTGLLWRLSPYYSVEMSTNDQGLVLIRQRFDFAAAHRLHSTALSEAENREFFGKCNNPSGHGHNYQLEPCVAVRLAADGRQAFTLADLEHVVDRVILERFDHKHLNVDTEEFGPNGVNPTVENIAKVFFGLLAPAVGKGGAKGQSAELRSVTVWETDRTSCVYPG